MFNYGKRSLTRCYLKNNSILYDHITCNPKTATLTNPIPTIARAKNSKSIIRVNNLNLKHPITSLPIKKALKNKHIKISNNGDKIKKINKINSIKNLRRVCDKQFSFGKIRVLYVRKIRKNLKFYH